MLRASNRPLLAYFDAIKTLRLRQVALILKAGYDPNLMLNARGQNGLQFMVNYFGATDAHFRLQAPINKSAYLSIAKLLLDSGLDPNSVDLLSGETVFYDAIRFNDKDIVALLLDYVDFSLRNKNGETALMCAARFGSKQVMRMILEHLRHLEMDGYFLRQRNRLGVTALELARVENLECAKVLTKHLITYGQHTNLNAALTRSSSHHHLLAAARPYHLRAAAVVNGYNPRASAALLNDSPSDYDSDILAGPYGHAPMARPAIAGPSSRAAMPYCDPKAAEFNQYLLEQQEQGGAGGDPQGVSYSDDEDYFGPTPGGGLTRSRSCMLGPASGSGCGETGGKQQKYATSGQSSKKGGGESGNKMGSWNASSAGRSTLP